MLRLDLGSGPGQRPKSPAPRQGFPRHTGRFWCRLRSSVAPPESRIGGWLRPVKGGSVISAGMVLDSGCLLAYKSTAGREFVGEERAIPTYDYRCGACGRRWEAFEPMIAIDTHACPACGARGQRCIGGGAAVIFKGPGWATNAGKDLRPSKEEA